MKVTMQMIAEKAGVSRGTVDKVLHNREGVSDPVRRKVKKIADDLGYYPNRAARALTSLQNPLSLAVIITHSSNPFFKSVKEGMESVIKEMSDYGVTVNYYYTDGIDPEAIISILDYLKEQNIDGIALRGAASEKLEKFVTKHFTGKGIPVVTYDSDLQNVEKVCYVGNDNIKSGRTAATLLGKVLLPKSRIAIFTGSNSVINHEERREGFMEAYAEKYPDHEVIGVFETLEQNSIAYNLTKQVIKNNPDINGIVNLAGCEDHIAQAVLDMGSQDSIKLVTFNFTAEVKHFLQEGVIDFSIGLASFEQGRIAMQALFDYVFFSEEPKEKIIRTPIYIAIDENIEYFI